MSAAGDEIELVTTGHRRESPEVTWTKVRIQRGGAEIGGLDYQACHACWHVMLGEIGLIEPEQNQGIGRHVLESVRHDVAGYRWFITPIKRGSETFWQRMRQAYLGEHGAVHVTEGAAGARHERRHTQSSLDLVTPGRWGGVPVLELRRGYCARSRLPGSRDGSY